MLVDATIRIWGDGLVPEEVSSLLGATPTKAVRKGEERSTAGDRLSVARTGMWALCTSDLVAGNQLLDHVKFLTDNFSEKIYQLRQSHKVGQVRISVIVSPGIDGEGLSSWNDEITADVLCAIAKMGASLALTVLGPSE